MFYILENHLIHSIIASKEVHSILSSSSTCKKNDAKKNTTAYSNREWRKIKREMKENRKNRTASIENEYIAPKRVLDTIVLEAPSFNRQSQLSSW